MRMQIVLDPRLPPRLLAEVRGQDWTRTLHEDIEDYLKIRIIFSHVVDISLTRSLCSLVRDIDNTRKYNSYLRTVM